MSIAAEPLFLLSAAAVLVAVLAPVLLAPRKYFTYAVLYDGLFEVAAEADGEDSSDDEKAAREQVRVIAVELRNSSGRNIERSHYVRPISVGFGKGARIVDAEVIEEVPSGIEASLRGLPERDPLRVALAPTLLNDGDRIVLEMVVGNVITGDIEVEGRVVGVKRIVEERRSARMKTTLAATNGAAAVLVLVLGTLYQVFSPFLDVNLPELSVLSSTAGVLAGLVVGDVLLIVALYRRSRHRARVRRQVLARHLGAEDSVG